MSGKRRLGVDCDGVLVNSIDAWKEWLQFYNGFGKVVHREDGLLPYNLSEMFPLVREPMQYWRELDYNQFKPMDGSVEALRSLSQYFDIFFISSIKGNHTKSKYYWLKEHYPFMTGYVATKEKYVCDVVAMVDDRLSILKKFDYDQRIHFETNYTQDVEIPVAMNFNSWDTKVTEQICNRYL